MLKFSLVLTNDPAQQFTWQVHRSDCNDVIKLIKEGAFADRISAESAALLVQNELLSLRKDGLSDGNFIVMPCCIATNEARSAAA